MTTIEQLAQRIETLELQNQRHAKQTRRWRGCTIALSALGVSAICLAAAPLGPVTRVLQTERLEILDNKGKLLMALGGGDTSAQIDLWNREGMHMMRLYGNEFGGDIALFNTNKKNVGGLYATATGGEMGIWNADGAVAVQAVSEARGGALRVHSPQHQLIALHSADHGGQVDLFNSAGAQVARTAVNTTGGELAIWASDGSPSFDATSTGDGGVTTVYNADGGRVVRSDADERGNGRQTISNFTDLPSVTLLGAFDAPAVTISNDRRQSVATLGNSNFGGAMNLHAPGGEKMFEAAVNDLGGALRLMNSQQMAIMNAGADAGASGSISVMNNRGIAVTTLNADPEGAGVVALNDATGKPRCRSTAGGSGGAVQLINAESQPVAVLGVSSGGGVLNITNNAGSRVGILGADADGTGRLDIATAGGTNVITASAVASTGGVFSLFNSDGNLTAQLMPTNGGGTLNLHDPGGNPQLIAGYSKNTGGAGLSIKNRRGMRVFYAGPDDRGSGNVTVWDPDGRYPVELEGDR